MPERYKIIISPEAAGDLEAIYQYVSRDSPRNAARLIARLLDAVGSLDTFPHRTIKQHSSDKLRQPVRSLPVRPYVVYFRVLEEQQAVRVLTVRHGARRKPRRFE